MTPKFRAWDRIKKRMFLVLEIDYENELVSDETYWNTTPFDDVKLMQSTGLRDKNGVEIYEGDIVRFTLTDGFSYITIEDGVVTYKLCAFYVVNRLGEYLISDIYTNDIEVIGNIYENLSLIR